MANPLDPNILTAGWYVIANSKLVWGERHPEDGERREIEVFFVQLENERGDRFVSNRRFYALVNAERCIAKVRRALAAGATPVNSPHWAPSYPVYGSPAYAAQERSMVAEERAVDEAGTYYDGGIHG